MAIIRSTISNGRWTRKKNQNRPRCTTIYIDHRLSILVPASIQVSRSPAAFMRYSPDARKERLRGRSLHLATFSIAGRGTRGKPGREPPALKRQPPSYRDTSAALSHDLD